MIAREGVLPVTVTLLLAAGGAGTGSTPGAVAGVLLGVLLVFVFRDIKRSAPALPLALLCPVDARLSGHGERRDPWIKRECVRVNLKLSILGMGVIRCPTEGQVREFWVRGGLHEDRDPDTASSPTCYAMWIQTDEGDDVVVAVYGRPLVSRFKADVSPGERIGQGHRLGFVYFGTVVTVYAPAGSMPSERVSGGGARRMRAAMDVLLTLPRGAAAA